MGLKNLVWHDHFWPGNKNPGDDDLMDELKGRHDACEDDQGNFFIWRADTRQIVQYCESRQAACEEAQRLANQVSVE